jgi:hypothetical protein
MHFVVISHEVNPTDRQTYAYAVRKHHHKTSRLLDQARRVETCLCCTIHSSCLSLLSLESIYVIGRRFVVMVDSHGNAYYVRNCLLPEVYLIYMTLWG